MADHELGKAAGWPANAKYVLNRLPIGIVILDADYRVVSYSNSAAEIFGGGKLQNSLGKSIQSIHPEHSRAKVEWLIAQAREEESSDYASMLINVPDTVLQLRVVQLNDDEASSGYCLILYDITDLTSLPTDNSSPGRSLLKIPISTNGRIILVNVDQITLLRANGHYSDVCVGGKHYFCGISLSQLEARLAPDEYVRVHRSFIVNLAYAEGIDRHNDQFFITMNGTCSHEIPVSRGHATRLRELLGV
ncbi:MAG: PAS domain-containing protein [Acidimicrobiaceae bacterium]|nr:PAS domain-containing protein [Acidimicrobiaceae bacterium]